MLLFKTSFQVFHEPVGTCWWSLGTRRIQPHHNCYLPFSDFTIHQKTVIQPLLGQSGHSLVETRWRQSTSARRAYRPSCVRCFLLCLSSVCGYLVILRPDNGFFRMAFVLVNSRAQHVLLLSALRHSAGYEEGSSAHRRIVSVPRYDVLGAILSIGFLK